MVVGLKQSTPFLVQAIPEVTFKGRWLAEKFSDNNKNLIEIRIYVQGIATNVNALSTLKKAFNSKSNYYIKHPQNSGKIFYNTVYLMKNIRNNLKSVCFQCLFI